MKTFIYTVGDFGYSDTVAFGQAWKDAKAKAQDLHCGIFREVRNHDTKESSFEFYAKGGCFLANRFYFDDRDRLYIF